MHRELHGYFVAISNVVINDNNKTNPAQLAALANLARDGGSIPLRVISKYARAERRIHPRHGTIPPLLPYNHGLTLAQSLGNLVLRQDGHRTSDLWIRTGPLWPIPRFRFSISISPNFYVL